MSEIVSLEFDCIYNAWCIHCFSFFNSQFLSKVEEKYPRDTDLIVACQKGLR
jgi:hypothetical protein